MIKLLDLLSEVFDTYYPVKDREMTEPPQEGKLHNRKRIAVFHGEGKKFIIEVYEYPHHFYLVAYYPKLNSDFAKSRKQPNKYRIQLNLKNKYAVLSTVFRYMKQLMIKDPLASVGFYGAPDLNDSDPGYSTYMSKRYRVYLSMIDHFQLDENHEVVKDPKLSAIILLSNESLKQDSELRDYALVAMDSAIG